jgi:hypothetical protein
MSFYTCFDWFKKLRLFVNERNLKIDVVLKESCVKFNHIILYRVHFRIDRNFCSVHEEITSIRLYTISLNRCKLITEILLKVALNTIKQTVWYCLADVGARNERRLCAINYNKSSGFEVMKGLLDRVMQLLEVPIVQSDQGYFIRSCTGKSKYSQTFI